MRKFHLFKTLVFLASTMLVFASCQKAPEELIVGTWTVVASEDSLYDESSDQYDIIRDAQVGVTFTFNADGSMTLGYPDGYSEVATWTYAEDHLNMTFADGFVDSPEVPLLEKTQMRFYYDFGEQNGHLIYASMDLSKKE